MVKMGDNPEQNPLYTTPAPELSDEQIRERSFDLYRLYQISQVRESALPQFDGMGYMRYNETNEMADISYLMPKKNKGDSRITSGITHEKDSSLVSFFLNLNFEGNVIVYYKGKTMDELGTALTHLVRNSREQEFYDQKRPQFYRNNVCQGTSFALEQYVEEWKPDKAIVGEVDALALDKVEWVDKGYKRVMCGCQSSLIDGKKVFMENIREPDIQKQNTYLVEYIPREQLQAIFGQTEMWKYVPYMVTPSATSLGTLATGSIYSDWIWGEIDYNKCESVRVYRPYEQRFAWYINGVPMLKPKFPLKAVSPSGLVPIAKGDQDLMNMFAYSKSIPAKMKIDQTVFDELLQNMLIKSRQSTFVPRVNNTDRILTPDMFLGGRTIANIDTKSIEPLIENPGITQSDFSFYELFKKHMDDKSIGAILEGSQGGSEGMTLGQYMDEQKKQMIKLGGSIDGIINWETQMLRLRTLNLLAHPSGFDDEGNYKDIPVAGTMFDGSSGTNVLKFDNQNIRSPYDIFDQQNEEKDETGEAVEYTYLNPDLMKQMLDDPDYYICYEVVPVDKNNDKLTQLMFVQMIQTAAELFGMDSLQVDKLKKRYAAKMGEQFDDIFLSAQELQLKQQQAQQAAMAAGQDPNNPNGNQPSPLNPQNASINNGGKNGMVEKMFAGK